MATDPLTGRPRGLSRQSGLLSQALSASQPSGVPARPKTLGMGGPFELNDAEIARRTSIVRPHGNYAFGNVGEDGKFYVSYVGRFSATAGRLRHGLGRYSHFKISFAATEKESVEKECRNYHDFMPPDNKVHPACPEGFCCPLGCP